MKFLMIEHDLRGENPPIFIQLEHVAVLSPNQIILRDGTAIDIDATYVADYLQKLRQFALTDSILRPVY